MHQDFITALWRNEPLKTVADRLYRELDEISNAERRKIREDLEEAQHILYSLRQPTDSFMHKWALTFIKEADAQEKKKNELRRSFEARRQQVEQELLEEEELKLERLKQERIKAHQEQVKHLKS